MAKSKILSSAKIVCYVNGKMMGRVTSFRWSVESPRKALGGIDTASAVELAPTTIRCTGSLGLLRLSLDGGIEEPGMTAPSDQYVRERYFTLTLIDRTTGQIVFRADRCSVTAQSWDVPEKAFVRGQVSFETMQWGNECRPSDRT